MLDRIPRRALLPAPFLALLAACWWPATAAPDPSRQDRSERWEPAIRAFEEHQRAAPPAKGGVVLLGSSSFRRWDLERYFPGRGLINRGFGGSQLADALRYLDRIVLPLRPRTVVLYEGDNDLASGKSPETVEREFRHLVERLRAALPETKIVFVSIKPSLRRWALIDAMRDANARIKALAAEWAKLEYVDIAGPMLGADGRPRPELFVEDGLHLSDAGYALWAERLAPHLE